MARWRSILFGAWSTQQTPAAHQHFAQKYFLVLAKANVSTGRKKLQGVVLHVITD